MKLAALVMRLADGRITAMGAESVSELERIARAARDTGTVELGRKSVGVTDGAILTTWRAVHMRFHVPGVKV